MADLTIREIAPRDSGWMKGIFIRSWGGDFVVSRGRVHRLSDMEGFVCEMDGKRAGLITFKVVGEELEITGLKSLTERKGIGTALVNTVIGHARDSKFERICLVTTNDNLNALGFWQKRGFRLVRVYPNAMENTRRPKPSVPLTGEDGIPLRDEVELEMVLGR